MNREQLLKFVVMLVAGLLWFGCNGGEDPPLECGENEHEVGSECVCNAGYARDGDGDCVKAPPPPPPPPPRCALPDKGRGRVDCYVTRERAGVRKDKPVNSNGLLRDMMFTAQELISVSRNFFVVSRTCGQHLGVDVPPFHVEPIELEALAYSGFRLHDGGRELRETKVITHPSMLSFIGEGDGRGRLERVHRDCDDDADDDPWCGRTGVFRPMLEEFRAKVAAHMAVTGDIDGRGGPAGFDGIRHFCESQ